MITVVDDFGHHPTAIRETLRALRIKYPHQKLWAIFEPRSNTTRRNVFQTELPDSFADADEVVVAHRVRATIGEAEGSRILARPEKVEGKWLQAALANLGVMYETTQAISHILDLNQLLDFVLPGKAHDVD